MKLFIGSGSELLGKQVAETTGIPIGKWKLFRFGDSEIKPQILDQVRGEDVIVFQSTSRPVNDAYMELFLLVDALRRSACGRIIVLMPYFGYARQNQQHLPGEPVSAQVMARFIESVGVDELITVDLHEEQLTGFFTIPVTHMSALPLLARAIGNELRMTNEKLQIIVVSPDQGGVERTRTFRDALATVCHSRESGNPENHIDSGSSAGMTVIVDEEIGIVEKYRHLESMHETEFVEIAGDVKGKTIVIPDDVIVSGGTIVNAAKAAMDKGAVKVYLAATHADFIERAVEKLQNSPVEKIFVTDTIEIPKDQLFPKLQVISVSNTLSEIVRKLGN